MASPSSWFFSLACLVFLAKLGQVHAAWKGHSVITAVVALFLGVASEQKPLKEVASSLSAERLDAEST